MKKLTASCGQKLSKLPNEQQLVANQTPSSIAELLVAISHKDSQMLNFPPLKHMASNQLESHQSFTTESGVGVSDASGMPKALKSNVEVSKSTKRNYKRKRPERSMTYPISEYSRKRVSVGLPSLPHSELSGIVPPGQRRAKILSLMGLSPDANFYPVVEPSLNGCPTPNPNPNFNFFRTMSNPEPVPITGFSFERNDKKLDSNWKNHSLCLSPTSPLLSDSQLVNILNPDNSRINTYSNVRSFKPEQMAAYCGENNGGFGGDLLPAVQVLSFFESFFPTPNLGSPPDVKGKLSHENNEQFPHCESINSSSSEPLGCHGLYDSEVDNFLKDPFNPFEDNHLRGFPQSNFEAMSPHEFQNEFQYDSFDLESNRSGSDGTLYSIVQSCGITNTEPSNAKSENMPESCLDNFSLTSDSNPKSQPEHARTQPDHFLSVEEFMEQLEELTELTLP